MTKKLIIFIKGNKSYLIVLIILILVFIAYFIDFNRYNDIETPYTVKESELSLIAITPPERSSQSLSDYEILWFEFSEPIISNSIRYTIEPNMEFSIVNDESNPNIVKFVPRGMGWEDHQEYTLKITALRSVNGNYLNETINYVYLNTPPDISNEPVPY